MVKNWTIIRAVLLRLEAAKTPNTALDAKNFEGFSEQEVAYNMRVTGVTGSGLHNCIIWC